MSPCHKEKNNGNNGIDFLTKPRGGGWNDGDTDTAFERNVQLHSATKVQNSTIEHNILYYIIYLKLKPDQYCLALASGVRIYYGWDLDRLT